MASSRYHLAPQALRPASAAELRCSHGHHSMLATVVLPRRFRRSVALQRCTGRGPLLAAPGQLRDRAETGQRSADPPPQGTFHLSRADSTLLSEFERASMAATVRPSPFQERAIKGDPCHRTRHAAPEAHKPWVFSLTCLTCLPCQSLRPPHLAGDQGDASYSTSASSASSGP